MTQQNQGCQGLKDPKPNYSLIDISESSAVATKLGTIKLKQIQQLNTSDSSLLIRKHKEVLNLMMRTLSLDTYGLTWAQFFKGFGLGCLVVWLLMR